jgi:beta-lactamase superfamily II metal-dependent hydrolase
MAISYTESGVAKTTSVPLTVTAASKTLMVRFKEILSGTYCDSILIKYGDWECLIDGGNSSDKATVASALSAYCTDHKLDMYIGTHSHNDHLGIFTSAKATDNVFIDGGVTSFGYVVDSGSYRSATFYQAYCDNVRDDYMKNHGATYIPVHAFFNSDSGYTAYQGQSLFTIDSNVSLRFLNTGNYLTPKDSSTESGSGTTSPNRYSVACLLSAWNQRYIFSGDGDENTESGIKSNNSDANGDPLYWSASNDVYLKANHHGSDSNGSNSSSYLNWVNPDHIMISAAIVSGNQTSSGVISEQHPYVAAVARMEAVTYDIHWNGINGTFTYSSLGGATPVFAGTAKEISYYYNGSKVTGEETTTFPMSKWCLSSTYSSVAKTAPTGHDLYRGSFVGSFLNASFRYDSLDSFASSAPAVNANGDLYDSLTDSYC